MPTNLVTNPSCETGTVSPWSARANCALDAVVSGLALDGTSVFRMTSLAAGDMDMHNESGRVTIGAGVQYVLSARVRPVGNTGRTGVLFADQISSSNTSLGTVAGSSVSCAPGVWTTISLNSTTPAGNAALRTAVRVNDTGGPGEQWLVEEIGLYVGTSDTSYQGPFTADAPVTPVAPATLTPDRLYRLGGSLVGTARRYRSGGALYPPSAAGTRSAALQPFSSTSPWNLGLSVNTTFEATSGPKTTALRDVTSRFGWITPYGSQFTHREWAPTVPTDPVARFHRQDGGQPDAFAYIRSTYLPETGSDHHLHVMQPDGRMVFENWVAEKLSETSFNTGRYALVDHYGSGIGPTNGTRAYGGSSLGGIVRAWEVDPAHPAYTGAIRHAVSLMLPWSLLFWDPDNTYTADGSFGYGYFGGGTTTAAGQPGWPVGTPAAGFMKTAGYVWPASEQDYDSQNHYAGPIPMGSLLAIDPSVDLTAQGFTAAGLMLARAYQDYGGYVCDTVGNDPGIVLASVEPDSTIGGNASSQAWTTQLIGPTFAAPDLKKILQLLRVVTSNTAATPGGGAPGSARRGVPIKPLGPTPAAFPSPTAVSDGSGTVTGGSIEPVTSSSTDTTITLDWATPAGAFTASGFNVYLDGTLVGTPGPTLRTFTLTGLTASTSYVVAVEAKAGASVGPRSTAPVMTGAPPAQLADRDSASVSDRNSQPVIGR